jgi:hypothetical protein
MSEPHWRDGNHRNEYHGVWWGVGGRTHKVPGVLKVHGPLTLELSGQLLSDGSVDLPEGLFRIAGELENGRAVCLEKCFATSSHGIGSRAGRETWHVHEVVFDAVFDKDEPFSFYGATLAVPLLTRWVRRSHVTPRIEQQSETNATTRFEVAIEISSFPLWEIRGAKLTLETSASTRHPSEWVTALESRIDVSIITQSSCSAHDLRRLILPLQLLLGL